MATPTPPPPLTNSQRMQPKATYVPIKIPTHSTHRPIRVMHKLAYLRSLQLTPAELSALEHDKSLREEVVSTQLSHPPEGLNRPFGKRKTVQFVELLRALSLTNAPAKTLQFAPLLANVDIDKLVMLGRKVATNRRATCAELLANVDEILRLHRQAIQTAIHAERAPSDHNDLPGHPGSGVASALAQSTSNTLLSDSNEEQLASKGATHSAFLLAAAWAVANNLPPVLQLLSLVETHQSTSTKVSEATDILGLVLTAPELAESLRARADLAEVFADALPGQLAVEPVGRLHLERLEMTPVGVEHGELVHSVPLAPAETVNITHREWTVTSQTFESLVTDSLEGFSETGVSEKTDLAQSTSTEARHTSQLDVNGSASASYNGAGYSVTASAAVDYNTHSEDSQARKDSVAHSIAVTHAASSRTRKEHKTTFRVSSVAGAEDLAVRVITNPSQDHAMRVDYYQLMRKWQVELIRYGLRMTYDLVIPDPGWFLADRVLELYKLDEQINSDHTFDVKVDQIKPDSWLTLAQLYGVEVDAPPQGSTQVVTQKLEGSGPPKPYAYLEYDVPEGFEIADGFLRCIFSKDKVDNAQERIGITVQYFGDHNLGVTTFPDGTQGLVGDFTVPVLSTPDPPYSFKGYTGKFSAFMTWFNIDSGTASLNLVIEPSAVTMEAWQLKVWDTLRQADLEMYNQGLEKLKARQAQITKELGDFDALTLRRMEREEIMKGLLLWLFGPEFIKYWVQIQSILADFPTSPEQWQAVLSYGELIKFLHNAVEWENVIFLSYPYFWDRMSKWNFKRFLVHPDPEHQAFLRAGAARVVFTIRPGFEIDFAGLVETGSPNGLPGDHPYVTIGEEIRNFAMANYEGIPPANPDYNVRPLLYPQQRRAWQDMQKLILLVEKYQSHFGVYPSTLTELTKLLTALPPEELSDELKQFLQGTPYPPKDPWGNDYVYSYPGTHNDFDLVCYGQDGKPNVLGSNPGTGPEADITSWAEGSIVGQWYEYTPTAGGMDIVLNVRMPLKDGETGLTSTPEPQ